MKYVKAIFFDFDGVIVDTESLYLELMMKYNKENNLYLAKDYYIKKLLGKTKNSINKELEQLWGNKYDSESYWQGLLQFRNDYISTHDIKIKDGFLELLDYLLDNNYYVAIVSSNSLEFIKYILNKVKIDSKKFNSIITREKVKKFKPFPDLYNYAVKESHIDKDKIIAIEDSVVGIKSVISAKLKFIYLKDISDVSNIYQEKSLKICETLIDVKKYLLKRS